ncbi:MAG: hypothetical protein CHACPFDD_03520 [Phycisphaerae bacterium]|nr:hypothetical protein [Phycisphaerae bacterium]
MSGKDKGAALYLEPETTASESAHGVLIPPAELPDRTHELPPRDELVRVLGPSQAADAVVAWLARNGRRTEVVVAKPVDRDRGHRPGELPPRLWWPAAFLEREIDDIETACTGWRSDGPLVALDLACGVGRDAVYLARRGWAVRAVDVLPDALARARDLERRYGVADRPICWVEQNLESADVAESVRAAAGDLRGSCDQGGYDLVYVSRYLHRPLLPLLCALLRPGGRLLYETFTTVHRERYGKPSRDAHVLRPNELITALSASVCAGRRLLVRHYREGWHGTAHTARVHIRCDVVTE